MDDASQKSVFECSLDDVHLATLEHELVQCIDTRVDSLRIYRLPASRDRYLRTYGVKHDVDYHGPLIV